MEFFYKKNIPENRDSFGWLIKFQEYPLSSDWCNWYKHIM